MSLCLSEAEYKLFRQLIKQHAGISYSRQKMGTLQRKLAARLTRLGLESFLSYYHYLLHDTRGKEELRQLINTITVDQTAFFRHPRQFELLADIVLPQLATQKEGTKKLRIWSAGCARGQEAYSIAMIVSERFGQDKGWDTKILASDIDTDALGFAHRGVYPNDCMEQIPAEYIAKYFTQGAGRDTGYYSITEALKKDMLFRRLNFTQLTFPFRSPVDIIFCRNVLIYFHPDLKKQLVNNFFRILERDGFLFLGASESLIGLDDRFALVGHSAYQKVG